MRVDRWTIRVRWLVGLGLCGSLLGGALGWAQAETKKPKVMIVIDEKVGGLFGQTGFEVVGQAESTLAERFMAAGFSVVDPKTVRTKVERDKFLRMMEDNERAAAVAGFQFRAQVVITGKAISKNVVGKLLGTNMQSLQATVQARAIRTDDATIIASRSSHETQAHIDEFQGGVLAIQKASRKVADALIADVSNAWTPGSSGRPRTITLAISGLVSYKHLKIVRSFLEKRVKGVQAVHQRQFMHGTAEFALEYAGTSSRIADRLASEKFRQFRLDPTSVTPNRVDVRAVLDK